MRKALLAASLVAVACVDQGPGSSSKKVDPKYAAAHLPTELPASGLNRLDVAIGDKVIYVGNKLGKPADKPGQDSTTTDVGAIAPGDLVRVTHYWRVVQPVGAGWRVFTLLRGAPHTADFMNLPSTDMQIAYGPALWKAGQLIEDIQDIPLRADWRSPTATLYVGLIAMGAHGIGDRMAASGNHTQDRAVIARVIDVDLSRAPPPPGTVHVPRATGEIMIDGAASEPAWQTATASPDFLAAEGSPEPPGKATAKLTWDDHFLYAFVTVFDNDVSSPYKNHDDPVWKADCVELFIDADGNRRGYVELQVNPNNATFDSWFETTRAKKGDESWESGMQTVAVLRGAGEPGGKGWNVEIAIPWQAVRGRDEAMAVRLPPRVGDRWRLNLVRVDVRAEKTTVSSWNRITYADFHALDRMLTAVFADASGAITPGDARAPTATQTPAAPAGSGSATK